MSGLDGALLPDEASGPRRVFEGDLVVPLMSPWLAFADLLRLAQTNRACMREISIGVREIGLTEFEDPATGRITDAVIASISRRFPSLRVLYLHQCVDITDAAVRHLACLPQLRELTISGCDVTSAGLSVLSDTLELLDLIPLAQCWSLRGLELVAPHVTNEGISYVSRLNSFKLSSNDRVTPAAFVGLLRRSPHIWGIYCSSCKHLEKSAIFWHCYREFENDHLQCHHPAMQSMAWHVPESELRELPPAAAAALGYEFEEV